MKVYVVGYRQPGFEPAGEVSMFASRNDAMAQNLENATDALAGLIDAGDWALSGPDNDGDYFVTLTENGREVFSWHYFVEEEEVAADLHNACGQCYSPIPPVETPRCGRCVGCNDGSHCDIPAVPLCADCARLMDPS